MKSKKLSLILSAALAGVALVTLSACSSSSTNANIITMKGDTIQVSDLYKEAKTFPSLSTTTLLQNITFDKMFESEKSVAKEATAKKVDTQYNTLKKEYGSQFDSALEQQGLTESNIKPYLKTQLLEQAAIEQEISKTQYTTANLKTAWESYHPDVTAYVVSETSKSTATAALAAAVKDAAGKASFEKANSSSKTTFDSTSTTVPSAVQTAAFKLKNGAFSSVLTATDSSTGSTTYYIVEMVKTSDKGTDMNKYKSKLKSIIKSEKEQDTTYVSSVIAKYLKKYNVTVKESAFSTTFQTFTQTSSSSN